MKSDANKRQVRIVNTKTGEARLSEPMPVHSPRQGTSGAESATPAAEVLDATSVAKVEAELQPEAAHLSKPKAEIETLEQFIEYAYGRKGQPLTLKPKTERLVAQNHRLDEGAVERLLALSNTDVLLAVPRQLLLLSREVEGRTTLRASLSTFVSTVMLRHPVFADPGVQAAIRNLPEGSSAAEALASVAAHTPALVEGKDPLKRSELQALRRNAAHLLATWFAASRGLNVDEVTALLLQVIWAPAAHELTDEDARLRAVTEIEQAAGVGLACVRLREQANNARGAQDQAQRKAAELAKQVVDLDDQRQRTEFERNELLSELRELRETTAAKLADLHRQHEVERTHLRHDQEQLRGRLVRRLEESLAMLEVGLTALRNKTPRTEVMVERAEHVVDALRAEATNLRED